MPHLAGPPRQGKLSAARPAWDCALTVRAAVLVQALGHLGALSALAACDGERHE
jgi:hypothetical protein